MVFLRDGHVGLVSPWPFPGCLFWLLHLPVASSLLPSHASASALPSAFSIPLLLVVRRFRLWLGGVMAYGAVRCGAVLTARWWLVGREASLERLFYAPHAIGFFGAKRALF